MQFKFRSSGLERRNALKILYRSKIKYIAFDYRELLFRLNYKLCRHEMYFLTIPPVHSANSRNYFTVDKETE